MNYAGTSNIIFNALCIAFILQQSTIPALKDQYITWLNKRRVKKWKSGKAQDLGNLNEVAARIRSMRFKPFDCIKCLSFWLCFAFALSKGMHTDSLIVGIEGYACGMLFEGILMRYL